MPMVGTNGNLILINIDSSSNFVLSNKIILKRCNKNHFNIATMSVFDTLRDI